MAEILLSADKEFQATSTPSPHKKRRLDSEDKLARILVSAERSATPSTAKTRRTPPKKAQELQNAKLQKQ